MAWLKRNLVLVISGVIALGLIAFGSVYLLSAVNRNTQMDEQVGQATNDLNRLMEEKPFPSPSNISQARKELERVSAFMAEARKAFPKTPPAGPLDNRSFKVLLQTTTDEMNKQAAAAGVKVETNYYYSFEAQKLPVNFVPQSLQPLADRLRDIQQVAAILFQAKINRLDGVRRSAVDGEAASGNDYLNEGPKAHPEDGVVIWPYEFTFQAFSPELAAVMQALAESPDAWIVRAVTVEPAEVQSRPGPTPAPVPGTPPPPRGRRGGAAAPAAQPGMETMLNERTLRVVMKLDVIRTDGGRPPR